MILDELETWLKAPSLEIRWLSERQIMAAALDSLRRDYEHMVEKNPAADTNVPRGGPIERLSGLRRVR